MYHVVLFEPEIPPNTGNIIRLCANSGATLHLIHPLGFDLNTKQVKRAGLDYHHLARVKEYANLDDFMRQEQPKRIFACTTKAKQSYAKVEYQPQDTFIFGPETRGLPESYLDSLTNEQKIRIPMSPNSRSINLANAVAIILFEAWRQQDFIF